MNTSIKRDETNGVLLAAQQVCKGCGQVLGVLKFRYGRAVRVVHRRAGVDQDVTLGVCISAIFFDEVAISATKESPVEITQIVTGIVLAVLGEFS